MRFIAGSLVGTGILCLCAAAGSGERPDGVDASHDEVFISDMPAERAPAAAREENYEPPLKREHPPLRRASADAPLSEPSPQAAASFEAFEFDGIQPGASTMSDVRQVWGEPLQSRQDSEMTVHQYAREPFEQVELTVAGDSVQSIVVRLRERFAEHEVAEQLQLTEMEPVSIFDRAGVCREKAYPERGVTLRSPAEHSAADEEPEAFQVAEIEFGELQSQLFLLRAQARMGRDERGASDDLDRVLALEPGLSAAWEMKVEILAAAGRLEDASRALAAALARSPNRPEFRLLRVELLAKLGNYEEAIAETTALAAQTARPAVFRAKVLVQWGRLLAEGPTPDFKQPIEYYQQAIKLIAPLVDDPQQNVRRAACETLVEAHLAMAYSIAWGRWKMKEIAVSKWLEQAEAFADTAIENGDLPPDYSLRISQMALAAHVGAQGALDPTSWADQMLETGRALAAQARDSLCRRRLQWQLGLACHDALQVFEMRQQFDAALRYGKLAVGYLEQGRPGRQETESESFMLGRLYYRLGTLHAQRLGEHDEAVAWYERALPLLERQTGDGAQPGRHGEELVTAAVSYWNMRQRDQALAMTARGIKLLERAVEQGDVEQGVLSVPYANLAAMHEQLGDRVEAASYSEQAASAKAETAHRP